jgi:hypothetical protein
MDRRHSLEISIQRLEITLKDAGCRNPVELIRLFAIGIKSEANAIADEIVRKRIDLELRMLEAWGNDNYDEMGRLGEELKPLWKGVFEE